MLIPRVKISEVLKSLAARDQEELSLLRLVVECAQSLAQATMMDLSLGALVPANHRSQRLSLSSEFQSIVEQIPEDGKRYLHALMEALDIYQSIHGRALVGQSLTLNDGTVTEIRQIRDMCMEEGLRSMY